MVREIHYNWYQKWGSRGWGPIIFGGSSPALVQVESTPGEPGSREGVTSSASCDNRKQKNKKRWPAAIQEQSPPSGGATLMEGLEEGGTQSPVEAVAVEVGGGVAEPLLGAYADLPLSPLPPEEDLLVLLGDKPTATEQNPSLPLQGLSRRASPPWRLFLVKSLRIRWGFPVRRTCCRGPLWSPGISLLSPGFRVSLGSLRQDLWKRSLMLPLMTRRQGQRSHKVRPLGSVIRMRWVRWTLVIARIPAAGSSIMARSAMVDHALSSHLPWYVRGDMTCL